MADLVPAKYALLYRGFRLAAILAVVDQFAKDVVRDVVDVNAHATLGVFRFGIAGSSNPDFVFSLPAPELVIIVVAFVVLAGVFYRWRQEALAGVRSSLGLAAVIGGAVSNLYDRFAHGGVYDWIEVGVTGWSTSSFNLADVFIVAGVLYWLAMQNRQPTDNSAPVVL